MRRKKYSVNIADWIGGTRGLSDRAYRLYDELCLLIAEAGGRLALRTEADEIDARKRLGCDRRKWFAALAELRAGDRPKLHLVDGWLVNKRVLIECDVLLEAIEVWGWSEARLTGEIGVEPRDIARARRLRGESDASGVAGGAVDHGDNRPARGAADPVDKSRSAASRPEVAGKSAGSLAEVEGEFAQNQEVTGNSLYYPLSYLLQEEFETPSPVPRARWPGAPPRKPLGETGADPPPGAMAGASGFRWARRETAESKLLLAMIGEGMTADAALELISRASDPGHPDFRQSARRCVDVSWRRRCGWYRPARIRLN